MPTYVVRDGIGDGSEAGWLIGNQEELTNAYFKDKNTKFRHLFIYI